MAKVFFNFTENLIGRVTSSEITIQNKFVKIFSTLIGLMLNWWEFLNQQKKHLWQWENWNFGMILWNKFIWYRFSLIIFI